MLCPNSAARTMISGSAGRTRKKSGDPHENAVEQPQPVARRDPDRRADDDRDRRRDEPDQQRQARAFERRPEDVPAELVRAEPVRGVRRLEDVGSRLADRLRVEREDDRPDDGHDDREPEEDQAGPAEPVLPDEAECPADAGPTLGRQPSHVSRTRGSSTW